MDLSAIIADIKQNNNNARPHLIYMGIGTSAGLREPDGTLADKNYHQYPPFLQNLKNCIPDLHISIILIDPYQENPPYMVQDKGFVRNDILPHFSQKCNDDVLPHFSQKCNDILPHFSQDHMITLYTLREHVYTDPYKNHHDDGVNITTHLREINNYAIEKDIPFIYHDFTGRDNRVLAEFFDSELKQHIDHIIYGLGLREDFGCYFDLTSPCSYHPYTINENGKIRFFNIYYYLANENLNCMGQCILKYTQSDNGNNNIINQHLEQIIKIVKYELTNTMLQAMRFAFRLVTGQEIKDHDLIIAEFNFMAGNKRATCLSLLNEKKHVELYEYLLSEFGKKLDIVSIIKKMDITGREILSFITLGNDPFKWYNNVSHFL